MAMAMVDPPVELEDSQSENDDPDEEDKEILMTDDESESDDEHDSLTLCEMIERLNPYFSDIVPELADVETFVISMDCLVVELCSHEYIDWVHGATTLPIVLMFETFLKSFAMKGGKFELIWFADLERIFDTLPALQLVRETLKKHIQDALGSEMTIKFFANPSEKKYVDYIEKLSPSFLLMSLQTPAEVIGHFNGESILAEFLSGLYSITLSRDNVMVVELRFMEIRISSILAFHQSPDAFRKAVSPEVSKSIPSKILATVKELPISPEAIPPDKSVGEGRFAVIVLDEVEKTVGILSTAFKHSFVLFCFLTEKTSNLSLYHQAQRNGDFDHDLSDEFMRVLPTLQSVIARSLEHYTGSVANVFNGKLLFSLLRFSQITEELSRQILPHTVSQDYESFKKLCLDVGVPESKVWLLDEGLREVEKDSLAVDDPLPITDIDHPVMREYAPEICARIRARRMKSGVPQVEHFFSPPSEEDAYCDTGEILFEEMTEDNQMKGFSEWEKKRALKGKQFLARWNQFYAETLGCQSLAVSFSTNSVKTSKEILSKKCQIVTQKKSSKPKPKTKAEEIIEKNKREARDKAMLDITQKLKRRQSIEDIKILNKSDATKKFPEVKAQVMFRLASILGQDFERVLKHDNSSLKTKREKSLELIRVMKQLLVEEARIGTTKEGPKEGGTLSDFLTIEQKKQVQALWSKIGLYKYSRTGLAMDLPSYLLQHAGELVDIQLDPVEDSRVTGFTPDGWQRRILDAIDGEESALIVAPTSSGKTFISFYCMEQVLRQDEDGVLVYVAPTKALVNQVVAEVQGRFHNKTYRKSGRTLYGVLTRDYHHDVFTSQILITVPQCLESLLLMNHDNGWDERIKYGIFDEVHCIGGDVGDLTGAVVWEHIILMLPSPFLALSATIGNPDGLHSWLSNMQSYKAEQTVFGVKSDVVLIEYNERFAELEVSLCRFAPGPDGNVPEGLIPFHPLSAYSIEILERNGVSKALPFTSHQIYGAYEALEQTKTRDMKITAPDQFLPNPGEEIDELRLSWLSRSAMRSYESDLMSVLSKAGPTRESVLANLTMEVREEMEFRRQPRKYESLTLERAPDLVRHLKNTQQLPALCFSDNRALCREFAAAVYISVVSAYKEKIGKYNLKELEKKRDQKRKMKEKAVKSILKNQKGRYLSLADEEVFEMDCIDPSLPKPRDFTIGRKGGDTKTLDKVIDRIRHKDHEGDSLFIWMLRFGIGVHHSGLSTAKRRAVEILYRAGELGVVFCTSTLALGVNMPCKTVVLCVDSLYLTPLQFRQISGRAGRRGFDTRGKVVFAGIPKKKITRLMTASLSKLRGNTPSTASLVLRIMCLLRKESWDENEESHLVKRVKTLLNNSFFAHTIRDVDPDGSDRFKEQMKLNFVFLCHFLRMLGMVDAKGIPVGLTGIFYRIHYHEPGNFILSRLFYSGVIRKICTQKSGFERDEALLTLFSHIFTNRPVNSMRMKKQAVNSKVILDDLESDVEEIISDYNEKVQSMFRFFLKVFVEMKEEAAVRLPISGIEYLVKPESNRTSAIERYLCSHRQSDCTIQGPIFAMMGNEDESVDLLKSYLAYPLSSTVFFDPSFLPAEHFPRRDHRGEKIPLNAYAVDFWRHGIFKAIVRDNKMMEGDVYSGLNDFRRILQTISGALDSLASEEEGSRLPLHEPVLQVLRDLAEDYVEKFYKRL